MPAPCFFEIPADNVDAIKKFYQEVFDWTYETFPMQEGEYTIISTKLADGKEGLNGGMMKRANPDHKPAVFFDVENIDEGAAKVEKAGGKIVVPKTPVPKMGWMVYCLDIEGNLFSLWQVDENAG